MRAKQRRGDRRVKYLGIKQNDCSWLGESKGAKMDA